MTPIYDYLFCVLCICGLQLASSKSWSSSMAFATTKKTNTILSTRSLPSSSISSHRSDSPTHPLLHDRLRLNNQLFLKPSESSDDDTHTTYFDVEAERKRLESLMWTASPSSMVSTTSVGGISTFDSSYEELSSQYHVSPVMRIEADDPVSSSNGYDEYSIPPPPPLTSYDRLRKEKEIELLSKLDESDESVKDLWDLWINERGQVAAKKLQQADALVMEGPEHWDRAESMLMELIHEYGIHWVEPSNRLATLYYLQGKLKAAEAICLVVLAIKPWHVGALTGIVLVYAGLYDKDKVAEWSSRRLPPLVPTTSSELYFSRSFWVNKNVKEAKAKLSNAEKILQTVFGQSDVHHPNEQQVSMMTMAYGQSKGSYDSNDSWQ